MSAFFHRLQLLQIEVMKYYVCLYLGKTRAYKVEQLEAYSVTLPGAVFTKRLFQINSKFIFTEEYFSQLLNTTILYFSDQAIYIYKNTCFRFSITVFCHIFSLDYVQNPLLRSADVLLRLVYTTLFKVDCETISSPWLP